ncbi:MAG: UbiA family prenyltransferase [Chloroflexota bacterium]
MPASRAADLRAYLALLDLPPVSLVLVAATGFTLAAARGQLPWPRLGPYLGALLLTQFAIALHNHYCDRHHDARAHPERALPRGLLAPRLAVSLAWGFLVLGLLLAFAIDPLVGALVALGTGAGFVYNAYLKRTAFSWLPYWVALPTLVVCSFALVGRLPPRLGALYLLALPLVLAVHLVDAHSDLAADRAAGLRGLAHRLGPARARLLAWLALLAAQALALYLWPAGQPLNYLFFTSGALLLAAVAINQAGAPRGHWLAAMSSAVTLALAWVFALAD